MVRCASFDINAELVNVRTTFACIILYILCLYYCMPCVMEYSDSMAILCYSGGAGGGTS